jgi:prepilin-type N-terminal cleavage/methylation domain-containing protein
VKAGGRTVSWEGGFTLLELLVVIAIFGMVAAITLPAIKGIGKTAAINAATRQVLDDVAAARQAAISGRSEVYVVFVPPYLQWTNEAGAMLTWTLLPLNDRRIATNLLAGQYTSYALFAARQVGDQPGQSHPRYLTPWRTLPRGTFFALQQFYGVQMTVQTGTGMLTVAPFERRLFPFPTASSPVSISLPCIGFDSAGRLINLRDTPIGYESIALAQGSVMPLRDQNGQLRLENADVLETPPGNSTNTFNVVRIDWLTGRARAERREVK